MQLTDAYSFASPAERIKVMDLLLNLIRMHYEPVILSMLIIHAQLTLLWGRDALCFTQHARSTRKVRRMRQKSWSVHKLKQPRKQ